MTARGRSLRRQIYLWLPIKVVSVRNPGDILSQCVGFQGGSVGLASSSLSSHCVSTAQHTTTRSCEYLKGASLTYASVHWHNKSSDPTRFFAGKEENS